MNELTPLINILFMVDSSWAPRLYKTLCIDSQHTALNLCWLAVKDAKLSSPFLR